MVVAMKLLLCCDPVDRVNRWASWRAPHRRCAHRPGNHFGDVAVVGSALRQSVSGALAAGVRRIIREQENGRASAARARILTDQKMRGVTDVSADRRRIRPIVVTSLAFVLGVVRPRNRSVGGPMSPG
jgi:hypothetical protein